VSSARFFKRGPLEVYKSLLDIRDKLPTDALLELQPSLELRAIRPWEEYLEGIIRWSIRLSIAAPGAGLNNGLMIACNGAGNNFPVAAGQAVPVGTLISIDEYICFGQNVTCCIGSSAGGLISAVPADYCDGRWGPAAGVPPVRAVSGSQGGVSGQQIDSAVSNQRVIRPGLFIGIAEQVAEPLGGNQTLTIFTVTANTALDILVVGRIVLPR